MAVFLKSLDGETKVIMEHTGRYYEPIAQVIHDRGLFVSAVNPLLIREYGGNSLRRVKTDKADAKKIARYGLDNWAELREYAPIDTIRYELKTLNRQFHLASKNRIADINNLISLTGHYSCATPAGAFCSSLFVVLSFHFVILLRSSII